jgi:hypothetical protein
VQRQSVCQQVSGDAVVEVAAPVLSQSQRPVALPAPTSMALTCRGGAAYSIKSAHFGASHQMPLRAGSPFLVHFASKQALQLGECAGSNAFICADGHIHHWYGMN